MSARICLMVLALVLGGCATCNRHPVVCAAGAVFVTGAVLAATAHQHNPGALHNIDGRPVTR